MSDSMLPVTHPREYLPVLDGIEMALDAACGALMSLQSIVVLSTVIAAERQSATVKV